MPPEVLQHMRGGWVAGVAKDRVLGGHCCPRLLIVLWHHQHPPAPSASACDATATAGHWHHRVVVAETACSATGVACWAYDRIHTECRPPPARMRHAVPGAAIPACTRVSSMSALPQSW